MFSAAIHTLGCKLNQLESEALAGAFTQAGFSLRPWGESEADHAAAPDILVINTCTVTSKADQKARRLIRKALRDNPRSCVMVTGCYAQLEPETIESLHAGDMTRRLFVLKGVDKSALLDLPRFIMAAAERAEHCSGGVDLRALIGGWNSAREPAESAFRFAPADFSFHTRAFLKIQDGCDNQCAYCRVRLARGPSRSLGAEQVLAGLLALEAKGYAEAVLTGVNITQYRDPALGGLGELLAYLLKGARRIAIRLSSLEPDRVTEDFAAVLAHCRIRPHFHLPVQSGSAGVLAKMGRGYGPETVEHAAALLRSVKDDPFLAADIITGFPGETEAEFERTRALCQSIGFAWIHAFPYSKRPGTPAFSFPETVSEGIAARRMEILLELARQGRREYIRRWTGRETGVLIEGGPPPPEGRCRGTSANYLKLLVRYAGPRPPPPGTELRCVIARGIDPGAGTEDAEADELVTPPGQAG